MVQIDALRARRPRRVVAQIFGLRWRNEEYICTRSIISVGLRSFDFMGTLQIPKGMGYLHTIYVIID